MPKIAMPSHAIVYDEEHSPAFKKPSSPLAQSQQTLATTSIASVLDVTPAETQKENHEDATDSMKSTI